MEYMMIRSVKAGGGGSDGGTSTLEMVQDHHHNHRQKNQGSNLHRQQSHQQQGQQVGGNLYGNVNATSNTDMCWNSSSPASSFSGQWQGALQPTRIPIRLKSNTCEEIVALSVKTESSRAVKLVNAVNQNLRTDFLNNKNHVTMVSQQPHYRPSSVKVKVLNTPLQPCKSSASKEQSVRKVRRKKDKKRGCLWGSRPCKNEMVEAKVKSCVVASTLSNSKTPVDAKVHHQQASTSSPCKRKAEEGDGRPNMVNNLGFAKKPRLSSTVPSMGELRGSSMVTEKDTLCSQMPNLLKPFMAITSAEQQQQTKQSSGLSSDSSGVGSLIEGKKGDTNPLSAASRPNLPIENIFLRKYDPIQLLTRLRSSLTKSKGSSSSPSSVANKIVVTEDFPRVTRNASSVKQKQIKDTLPKYSNSFIKYSQSPVTLMKNVKNASPVMPPPKSLPPWSKSKRRAKSKLERKKTGSKVGSMLKERSPKYYRQRRRLRVHYRSTKKGISEERLRLFAAACLKRALTRLRGLRRLGYKIRHFKRHKVSRYRRPSCKPSIKPTEKKSVRTESGFNVVKRVNKVNFAHVKLPKPILLPSVKVTLPENQYLFHTIELLRHKRELQDRLDGVDADGVVYKLGAMPDKPEPTRIPFLTHSIPMKSRQAKQVISERLLVNLAHAGFTHTKLRPLEVMADVVADFLTTTALRLKNVSEVEMLGADHGFPDPMERVLNELGMGGIRGLEEFYRTKVLGYGQRMEEQCLSLRRQYAYKVRPKIGLGNSSCSSSTSSSSTSATTGGSTPLVGGSAINCTGSVSGRPVISSSKPASNSSSQPLSPGNSVLAEILSGQEDSPQGRTMMLGGAQSPSVVVGMGEKQVVEELMGAPPNVEIRPNSVYQQQQSRQQLPLHQLLASLSQQPQQQQQHQQQLVVTQQPQLVLHNMSVPTAVAVNSAQQVLSPARSVALSYQQLQSQASGQQLQQQYQNHHHPNIQSSSQGLLHHNQPHLTQLLQRPISNHHQASQPILHSLALQTQQQRQQQGAATAVQFQQGVVTTPTVVVQQQQHLHQNSPSQANPQRNVSINTTTTITTTTNNSNSHHLQNHHGRSMVSLPIQISIPKAPGNSATVSKDQTTAVISTVPISHSTLKTTTTTTNNKGKSVTIIRSANASSPGIIVNSSDRGGGMSNNNNAAVLAVDNNVLPDFSAPSGGGNNVISINLGSNSIDLDNTAVPQITMHAAEPGLTPAGMLTASSKAKLKETINQRNLLRLNFEQVPSTAESTVLLSSSSSSTAPMATVGNAGTNVQFVGKVNSGQTISWNSNYP